MPFKDGWSQIVTTFPTRGAAGALPRSGASSENRGTRVKSLRFVPFNLYFIWDIWRTRPGAPSRPRNSGEFIWDRGSPSTAG